MRSIDGRTVVHAAHWKASGKKIVIPAGKRELVPGSTLALGFSKPSGFRQSHAILPVD